MIMQIMRNMKTNDLKGEKSEQQGEKISTRRVNSEFN
jgi:hypothetical protein